MDFRDIKTVKEREYSAGCPAVSHYNVTCVAKLLDESKYTDI